MLRRSSKSIKRCFSSLNISEEIRQALNDKTPIVSLESTIITHGLPFPQNLQMAQKVESEIRKYGAIPATTAFINGVPKVGLLDHELELLANSSNAMKVSRRDIPFIMSQKLNGGTTISGTMILSNRAGIKVFATGGLGGVHRDGENTMDISADLDELGKTPVAVVCAGPKSILDIERTMEYLETKGVFVGTYGPDGTNIPGFYTRDSGINSVYNFQDYQTAANIIKQGESLNLSSGMLFCIPPPENVALDSDFINDVIDKANHEAVRRGIKGKKITPFLLSNIAEATKGESVKTNIEFVLNNARAATQIAVEYTKLGEGSPFVEIKKESVDYIAKSPSKPSDSIVIGSIALDRSCLSKTKVVLNDSNPSNIVSSIGGVGYNVALQSFKFGNKSLKFVSTIGNDVSGKEILGGMELPNHSIEIKDGLKTSEYISFHDPQGGLVVAAADMGIVENLSSSYIEQELNSSEPKLVLMDANLSPQSLQKIIDSSIKSNFYVIFEPTSAPKSTRLSKTNLNVFPENSIVLSTPTLNELKHMYESFEEAGQFELDNWFPIIDALEIDKSLRIRMETISMRNPMYKRIISEGILQAGVSLLPYIKTLVIKDGSNGVYLLSIHQDISQLKEQKTGPEFSLICKGKTIQGKTIGVLFEHYSVPVVIEGIDNVTGAGDALAGFLLHALTENGPDILSSDLRAEIIQEAQKAAANKLIEYRS